MNTETTAAQSTSSDQPQYRGLAHNSACASTSYYDEFAAQRYEARMRAEAEAAASK
jgi:hypothetical protein